MKTSRKTRPGQIGGAPWSAGPALCLLVLSGCLSSTTRLDVKIPPHFETEPITSVQLDGGEGRRWRNETGGQVGDYEQRGLEEAISDLSSTTNWNLNFKLNNQPKQVQTPASNSWIEKRFGLPMRRERGPETMLLRLGLRRLGVGPDGKGAVLGLTAKHASLDKTFAEIECEVKDVSQKWGFLPCMKGMIGVIADEFKR